MANYHHEHFYLHNMRFLTLSRPLIVDAHGGFRSTGTDPMIVVFFFEGAFTYQYRLSTSIQPIDSPFCDPALNESINC
jgi:hypothetical protein